MTYAPIALFAYKRPNHLLKTLTSLSECDLAAESRLVVFCDGPKRSEDVAAVREVRDIVKSRQWCGRVDVVERDQNVGLAKSIAAGVSTLCEEGGRVIVLEDDLQVSPYFLRYMNEALERYKDEERVMQISGHMFETELESEDDALFLSFVTSWGWATWKRAWMNFDKELKGFSTLKENINLQRKFDLNGNYRYFEMLTDQIAGKIDSWAIVWNFSVFMRDGLVLYPKKTLVYNSGFDGSGTHCGNYEAMHQAVELSANVRRFPDQIVLSKECHKVHKAIRKLNKPRLLRSLRHFFKMTKNN